MADHANAPASLDVSERLASLRRYDCSSSDPVVWAALAGTLGHESSRALLGALGFSAKGTVDSDFAQRVLEEGELLIIELGDE